MGLIHFDKFSLDVFWEKTPTPLKYILIIFALLSAAYFIVSKKIDDNHIEEILSMREGIESTYELIGNFEDFRKEQQGHNDQVSAYLENLHTLVDELNSTTNRKLDMILNTGGSNTRDIIEKIELLNESFEKVSKLYQKPVINSDYRIGVQPRQQNDK